MLENTILTWWPQISALAGCLWYMSKLNTTQSERIAQLEKKVENLFILWNKHMDRLIDRSID